MTDGRVFERYSRPQWLDGRPVGRVWSYRDVTDRRRAEEAVREEARMLDLLNRAGAAISSTLELDVLLQKVTDAGRELSEAEFGAFFYNATDDTGNFYQLYTLSGATAVALYSNANTATGSPAVTVRSVGAAGGTAAAFTFDLARSVVYTRQGNPDWAGQDRDGLAPVRSDDMFFGGAEPDYVDLNKVAIPQADEQQRLLANLITIANFDRKPLPRFWYLPHGHRAALAGRIG